MKHVAIFGCGNADRGDDGAGAWVARELAGLGAADIHEVGVAALRLVDLLPGYEHAIIVDATVSGDTPGTIHRIEVQELLSNGSAGLGTSTHGLGVREALALLAATAQLPARVTLIGIEADHFLHGSRPCSAVQEAIRRVVDLIRAELAH
jgi:hydrogenase maturation protease